MENLDFFEGEIRCYKLYINQIENSLTKVWSNLIKSFTIFLFQSIYVSDYSGGLF